MPGYAITIDAGIAHLVLTRPNAGNALSAGFWKGLAPDIGALDRTGDVRAMVLSSEGPIFCAGMDLGEFAGGIPGALQRLPKILPEPVVKEMAFLGRTLSADDAARHGFVADIADTSSGAVELAYAAARRVLEKAPVAIAGTKAALRWARDHSVSDALEWSARTQSALWSTRDISSSLNARKARTVPEYEPLLPKAQMGRLIS